jgi:hypothetical protein
MSSKDEPKKQRPICQLKHPRAFDKRHGYRLNEELFEGLTLARTRKPKA